MRTFELIDRRTGEVTFSGKLVTRRRPCVICGKPDWCLYDPIRNLTICPRTPGGRQIGDAGYLHGDSGVMVPATTWVPKPQPKREPIDFGPYAAWCVENVEDWGEKLAAELGVSVNALSQFAVGWDRHNNYWTFPMLNEIHAVIGIRIRLANGGKMARTGSMNGLFIPMEMSREQEYPLFIEEGPTSAAALLNLGLDAIGRPSCSGCVDMTVDYVLAHHRHRDVVIVGNYDEAKQRPNGHVFYPGQEGAAHLADALSQACVATKVIFPTCGKDSRDWLRAGATRDAVMAVVETKDYWRTK